jgi:hypothetical protein
MEIYYLVDYFLFTFFASLGVIQLALSKKYSTRFNLGVVIMAISYLWFFTVKDRNVPTIVEGVQLFVVFGIAVILAIISTRIFAVSTKKR